MAKKLTSAPEGAHEEEMSVVVLRFKGSGDTLRRGMDTVAQALATLGGPAHVISRAVNGRKPVAQLAVAGDTLDSESVEESDGYGDESEPQDTDYTAPPGPKAAPKPRKFEFISTISDNATTSLKEFVAQRNPSEINDKYLVACLWLQTAAGFDVFTADHVWTCFQMMDWKKLADFTQPMRMMKSKKSYFDAPKKGDWKLNPHGLAVAQAINDGTS